RQLGAGGMGVVYEAFDRERANTVALKTLIRVDAQALYRFKNEFRSLSDLDHPNLVRLGELFCEGDHWFFTMELVEGCSFRSYVRPREVDLTAHSQADTAPDPQLVPVVAQDDVDTEPNAAFDERRLRSALVQLAQGLAALHAAGKVHRDIKPSNIHVTPDERVVLLDFGLVVPATSSATVTDAQAVGTALYMAPEQAASKAIGPEADWYAFGCVLFEALTGRTPIVGAPLDVLMDKQ